MNDDVSVIGHTNNNLIAVSVVEAKEDEVSLINK